MAWLSPAVSVEPALFRAVCRRLGADGQDCGLEAAVWLHDDVIPGNTGFSYKPKTLERHRRRFKALAKKHPPLADAVVSLLRRYHAHVFPTQFHEEMLIIAELMGERLNPAYRVQVDDAVSHFRQLLKALNEKAHGSGGLPAFSWHL